MRQLQGQDGLPCPQATGDHRPDTFQHTCRTSNESGALRITSCHAFTEKTLIGQPGRPASSVSAQNSMHMQIIVQNDPDEGQGKKAAKKSGEERPASRKPEAKKGQQAEPQPA